MRALFLSSLQLENILAPGWHDQMGGGGGNKKNNVTLPGYFIDCLWKMSRVLSSESSNQSLWMWTQFAFPNAPILSLTPCDPLPLLTFHHLQDDAKERIKIILKHNCAITSLSTSPFPPHPPPSRSNWRSNLSWCCVQVERRTSSSACSLFRSLSTAHICIDLQLFWSCRDGWQLYHEADPYWSERAAFTRPSFDGGRRRSWLK